MASAIPCCPHLMTEFNQCSFLVYSGLASFVGSSDTVGCFAHAVLLRTQMPSYQTFTNAPITEALLDIQVSWQKPVDFRALEPFCEAIAANYPNRRFRKEFRAQFSVSDEGDAVATGPEGGIVGYLLTSADGSQIAQARVNGFSFSRLRPYQDWERFRSEASRLWDSYLSLTQPDSIEQIALRYINRLELPLPFGDFREYVRTAPDIAPGLPQSLSHFLMQLQIPSPAHDAIAIVTETMEAPIGDETSLPFILDIDAVRTGKLDPRDEALWDRFEKLHDLKNEVFFHSITDKAKELFE